MLSFTRRHLVIALVVFCCAVFALANFSPRGKVDGETAPVGTSIPVSLPNTSTGTSLLISIPITVGDTTGRGIISYDLQISFDPAVLSPASPVFDQTGTISSGMTITPNANNPGHLIISAFQATNLSGSGTLLNLRFFTGPQGTSTTMAFADYTDPGNVLHPGFLFNEGDPPAATTNGSVTIFGATPTVTATFTVTPNNTPTFTPTPTNTPTSAPSATPTGPQYQIFDIGVVVPTDSASQGFGVSTGGVAVGRSVRTGGAQAFTYTGGGGIVGLPNLAARPFCVSNAAIDDGVIVGGMIVGTCSTTLFGTSRLPTAWINGVVSQLPLPAGETLGDAYDVNSSAIAVGSVNSGSFQRGVYYSGGTASVITQTTSNGSFFTTAFGINDASRIVGIGIDPNNAARNVPMVWDFAAGTAIDIGALPGFNSGIAFAISNGGHVVGSSMLNQGSGLPFIWTQGGGMVAIPLPDGTTQGSARGVNTAGWAVGTASSAFAIPFVYTGTATYRLADLIPAGTGWDLSTNTSSSAMGISDNNIIVGTGVLNGAVHAYAMVPAGAASPTPTSTTTATSTPTSSAIPTHTNTFTPTATFTPTNTATPTHTATATPTPTAFHTETSTPNVTPTATPSIQFSSATYSEDESQIATITVTRSGNVGGPSVVSFSTTNGTATGGAACTSSVDYISTFQVVAFNPGETSKTANVTLCGDNITEPDQTVTLSLGNAVGGTLGTPSTAVLTINDTATTFRNSTNIAINGGGPGGPYPSTITVSGGPPTIGSMRVTLYDFSSQSPDNADFLLVGPNGTKFILLAGGGGLTQGGPATLNFTDTAGQVVPDNGPLATGDFEPTSWLTVGNFPAPAPAAPYNQPGSTVGGNSTQTLFGNFGGTDANGVWSLYLRDRSLTPATIGNVAGGWGLEFLASTAAGASISGRVLTADGLGIRNAKVVVTGNSLLEPLVVTTGSFGYFSFDGLATGETYVVTVNSQRYTFSTPSRVISLVDNVTDTDFVADPLE